jgi:hypothetical protein
MGFIIQLPTTDQGTASHYSTAPAIACRPIHDFIARSQIPVCNPSSIKQLIGSDTPLFDPARYELRERHNEGFIIVLTVAPSRNAMIVGGKCLGIRTRQMPLLTP